METSQKFSLGRLSTPDGTVAPSKVSIDLKGRGIFCWFRMDFDFQSDDPSVSRVFLLDRPWNAVLTKASINGEPISENEDSFDKWSGPPKLRSVIESELQEGSVEVLICFIEAGRSLRTLTFEFVMCCDVLWHKSLLSFVSASDRTSLSIDASWDLSGLPGAELECTDMAGDGRFTNLDDARRQWIENLTLAGGESVGIALTLDERKAASICLYSSPEEFGHRQGCGAVVVVAPVRPQLVRKRVRVIVMVEVRNPQEGLLNRELVDQLTGTLGAEDEVCIHLLGSSKIEKLLDWTKAPEISEDDLGGLLEPSVMGRSPNFWETFQQVLEDCPEATHVLLSTPGPKESYPEDLNCPIPVYAFATGRKSNTSVLEDLTILTGGFLSEQSVDEIESFLNRVKIRLSPPLLRDFRLEGWGLEQIFPAGVTQVYTDKPTLVIGLYHGLLPQTVTLGGLSPAGQKLAQRVRVENFNEFDLMPLFEERTVTRSLGDRLVKKSWTSENFALAEVSRPIAVQDLFRVSRPEGEGSGEMFGPPSIDLISTAVTLDDDIFGSPSPIELDEELFATHSQSKVSDDFFARTQNEDDDMFFGQDEELVFGEESVITSDSEEYGSPLPLIDLMRSSAESMEEPSEVTEESERALHLTFSPPESDGAILRFEQDTLEPVESPSRTDTHSPIVEAETSATDDVVFSESPEEEKDTSEATAPALASETHELIVERRSERPTLSVSSSIPDWFKKLTDLDENQMAQKLVELSIDHLALALSSLEDNMVESVLQRLPSNHKAAVKNQIGWSKLLTEQERLEGAEKLEAEFR